MSSCIGAEEMAEHLILQAHDLIAIGLTSKYHPTLNASGATSLPLSQSQSRTREREREN